MNTKKKQYCKHGHDTLVLGRNSNSDCIACIRERAIEENYRNSSRKAEIFSILGGRCVRCGFDDHRALQVDHINGGGNKERKAVSSSGTTYYKFVLRELIEGKGNRKYQLLCANCNWIKKFENKEVFRRRGQTQVPTLTSTQNNQLPKFA